MALDLPSLRCLDTDAAATRIGDLVCFDLVPNPLAPSPLSPAEASGCGEVDRGLGYEIESVASSCSDSDSDEVVAPVPGATLHLFTAGIPAGIVDSIRATSRYMKRQR